jgi:protein-S-isoprenylcysteine O-methyltransferase Ste14
MMISLVDGAVSTSVLVVPVTVFLRSRTTMNPLRPRNVRVLVTGGIYSITRNPMYVGMTGLLAAHAIWRGWWAVWIPVCAFALLMDKFQVPS